jgi:hypothetical protein
LDDPTGLPTTLPTCPTDNSATLGITVILGSGALTKFDISENMIRAEGGKLLAAGLKGNQVIIVLNIADNQLGLDANVDDDMSGIIALADVIPGMGALSNFTFGDKQAVTMTTVMTDANFSGKLKPHEAQSVAAFLPKCT